MLRRLPDSEPAFRSKCSDIAHHPTITYEPNGFTSRADYMAACLSRPSCMMTCPVVQTQADTG